MAKAQPAQAQRPHHGDGPHQSWRWWHLLGMPHFGDSTHWETPMVLHHCAGKRLDGPSGVGKGGTDLKANAGGLSG